MGEPILSIERWLQTPLGSYLKAWEQAQCDAIVADLFGYHALQLGLPDLHTLQTNRMPHRWLAVAHAPENFETIPEAETLTPIDFVTDYTALPFFEKQPRFIGIATLFGTECRSTCYLARSATRVGA